MRIARLATFAAGAVLLVPTIAWASDAITVEASGDEGAVLERGVSDETEGFMPRDPLLWSTRWTPVCVVPCTATVPRGSWYRIGGDGVRPSEPLSLDGAGDRVRLRVKRASEAAHTGAIVVTTLGGLTIGSGVVMLVVGAFGEVFSNFCVLAVDCSRSGTADVIVAGGMAGILVGTLLLVAGISTLGQHNASTLSIVHPVAAGTLAPRTTESRARPIAPSTSTVPLLTIRF